MDIQETSEAGLSSLSKGAKTLRIKEASTLLL